MPIVFQEKELMGINLLMFIIYASQKDVNVNLAEDGLDLVLVFYPQFWLTTRSGFAIRQLVLLLSSFQGWIIDRVCRVEIGSVVLARMLEQIFDDIVDTPLRRKVKSPHRPQLIWQILLITVELCADTPENENLVCQKIKTYCLYGFFVLIIVMHLVNCLKNHQILWFNIVQWRWTRHYQNKWS